MKHKCRIGLTGKFINSATPEDIKRIAIFFEEIKKIEGVEVNEEILEISYEPSQSNILQLLADKYLLQINNN